MVNITSEILILTILLLSDAATGRLLPMHIIQVVPGFCISTMVIQVGTLRLVVIIYFV